MISRKLVTQREFEDRTRPRLLLFLSVDMQNSTRMKQTMASRQSQDWLATVLRFIEEFPKTLRAQQERIQREQPKANVPEFRLWKVLGDELVFVAELRRRSAVTTSAEAFISAIGTTNARAREEKEDGRLLVKGAAWTAGFPVTNAVLEATESGEDYVGPSMDIGFRIAKAATPQRIAISVELAWLLLKCRAAVRMHFEGRADLKGVAEETGYPELWIEVEQSNYQRKEDALLGRDKQLNRRTMRGLCEAYLREYGVPNYLPFLIEEAELTPRPAGYEESLINVRQFLRETVYTVTEEPGAHSEPKRKAQEKASADPQGLLKELREALKSLPVSPPP